MPEPPPVVLRDVGEGLEQVHRRHDDVVEVERVGLAQPPLVEEVRLGELLLHRVGGLVGVGLLVDQLVLEVADLRGEGLRRVLLRVQVEVAADQGHQPLRVGRVVDRERRGEAEQLGLAAQDPHAGAVEGGHPHRPGARADQLLDALAHLAGRLVGEGDRQDLAGLHAAGAEQVGDPVGEHPGLAGAGAGHDQQRRAGVQHGLALRVVHALQQCRRVDHRAGGAVAVEGVPLGLRGVVGVEQPLGDRLLEGVVRDVVLVRRRLLVDRRRGLLRPGGRGLETGEREVVKEAIHGNDESMATHRQPRPALDRTGRGRAGRPSVRPAGGRWPSGSARAGCSAGACAAPPRRGSPPSSPR